MNILTLFILTIISVQSEVVPFRCTVKTGETTRDVNVPSTVSCSRKETLVSCGINGWQGVGGTYIDPSNSNTCTAITKESNEAVTAVANCCRFPKSAINSVSTTISQESGLQVTATCPSKSVLTGCQVTYSSGNTDNIRGSYAGNTESIGSPPPKDQIQETENKCTAEAWDQGTNVIAGAQCIEFKSRYSLDCITTSKLTTNDGLGKSSCPTDYQLIGCNVYAIKNPVSDWHLQSDGKCYVQQFLWGNLYANGICCQLNKRGTDETDEYQAFVELNNKIKKPIPYNWITISFGLLCLIMIISVFYQKYYNKKVEILLDEDGNHSEYGSV